METKVGEERDREGVGKSEGEKHSRVQKGEEEGDRWTGRDARRKSERESERDRDRRFLLLFSWVSTVIFSLLFLSALNCVMFLCLNVFLCLSRRFYCFCLYFGEIVCGGEMFSDCSLVFVKFPSHCVSVTHMVCL